MNISKNPILNVKIESDELSIELSVVKNFLKVDFDNDDELISKLIKTATTQCETNINKTLIEKTYVYSIYDLKSNSILLPYPTIKSIEEIRLVGIDGSSKVLTEVEYYLDTVGGMINLNNKPSSVYRMDIEYTAGLSTINDELIQGLLMHIARMYEDRSGYSPIPLNSLNIYKKYKQVRL